MRLRLRPRGRPSRTALLSFGVALAVTTGGAAAVALATGGETTATPSPSTPVAPTDHSPQVPGLAVLSAKNVPATGLVVGDLQIHPTGATPDVYGFKVRLGAGETYVRWEALVDKEEPTGLLKLPESALWTVERGAELAVDRAGTAKILNEVAIVRYQGLKHDWELGSGLIIPGAKFPAILSEREGANFTYVTGGVTAFVEDLAPTVDLENVWTVSLVIRDRWVFIYAAVTPFADLAQFVKALVDANR